jgi:predicted proteasome-type protease
MSKAINIFGITEVKNGMTVNKNKMIAAINSAMYDAANDVLNHAMNIVPIDTGNLKASGDVTHKPSKAEVHTKVKVSFGGPTTGAPSGANYAIYVHENLKANHSPPKFQGGQAKYLEKPFLEETSKWPNELVKRIRVWYHG